ncbi:MAG: UDP-N-acetylglucosamine--N-acetylmuramyl-(pentapeptide) pyrophosphoryl-undecaprenol N-acetylglucosamine transferase [Actinomycetales bacterium]|nr:UDP-N-acetylglucosamine--N-acetylmuramyl-(pentapeptide) pyrophosphoryl-undecaprenol N-acetylglucosamine transferase [Actinomycetales bacterium]
MTNYLLAGGGTAGHVNPLLALADAIKAQDPNNGVWALGTAEGLESNLVPARGYELLTVAKLPFPRKPSRYALTFPVRFAKAVLRVQRFIREHKIDVVVGFGGYASAPAYVAAKRSGVPIVVHEANALPGFANKLGAKYANHVAVAFASTPLPNAIHTGMPLRREIEDLAKTELESPERSLIKSQARMHFGLASDASLLLVTGGSLGAKRINDAIEESRAVLDAAGIQVLHIVGGKSELQPIDSPNYKRIGYCDRMELAIAAADFAVSRAGSSTVSEFAAVGLPAVYVPYAVGNGEQRFNVEPLVAAGGGLVVADSEFTGEWVRANLVPLVSDTRGMVKMAVAARQSGIADGTERLLNLTNGVLRAKN